MQVATNGRHAMLERQTEPEESVMGREIPAVSGAWKGVSVDLSVDEMLGRMRQGQVFPDGHERQEWAGWENTRLAHIALLHELIHNPPAYPGFEGRGIVSCVSAKPGNTSGKELSHGYLPGAFVMVKELRRLGCMLPVTFAHMGPLEFDWKLTGILEPYGVNVIDLHEATANDPWRILAGFESKIAAIRYSPYRDVLYIDADNVPVKDPSFLFDSQQFRHYGAILWPDLPPYDRAEWLPSIIWKNIGMDFLDVQAAESGQVMVNKEKCWLELNVCRWMNEHSDWFYRFIYGDKDSFVLAWRKIADMVRRGEIPTWPAERATSYAMPLKPAGWHHRAIEQHDFCGDLLFQHACRDKPGLSGYGASGYLRHEQQCNEHLAELRKIWDGKLWWNVSPSLEERAAMGQVIGRTYRYERVGLGDRLIRFLQDGAIGLGRERCETNWGLFCRHGEQMIIVSDVDWRPTLMTKREPDGRWTGRWFEHERAPVVLTPMEESQQEVA